MGVTIKDGRGSGREAEVTSGYAMRTESATVDMTHEASLDGLAFTWSMATYDYDAADTVLLVRNDSRDYDLVITDLWFWSDTETEVQAQCPTATFTAAGTAVTGVCMNRKVNFPAPATAIADETGNSQGALLYRMRVPANVINYIDTRGGLILGADQAVGLDYVTAGTEAHAIIQGYFKKL